MRISHIILLLLLLIAAGVGYLVWSSENKDPTPPVSITSFEDCATYYAVMESHPRQCRTPQGTLFVEFIGLPAQAGNELEKANRIVIESPRPNGKVVSPLLIKGRARGNWYFEASFPVELQNASGTRIAITPAQAKGEWMTAEFVPFEVTLTFPPQPAGSKGTLILRKDNPSGLQEHDDELIVPVVF